MATFIILLLRGWRAKVRGPVHQNRPGILRKLVDDVAASDAVCEQSIVVCARGLVAIQGQRRTICLQVLCVKSAIVAAPNSHGEHLQRVMGDRVSRLQAACSSSTKTKSLVSWFRSLGTG